MKKAVILLFAGILMASLLTGCGKTNPGDGPTAIIGNPPLSVLEEVTEDSMDQNGELQLVLEEQNEDISFLPLGVYLFVTDYKDGILTATLSNQSGCEIYYGQEYGLEKQEGDEWVNVESLEPLFFTQEAILLQDLEEAEIKSDLTVFGDLEPGTYRLVKGDVYGEFVLK